MEESDYLRLQSPLEGFRFYMQAARAHEAAGRIDAAWACLEAAHILGQHTTCLHVRSHVAMLGIAWRTAAWVELAGQLARSTAAALATWLWVPTGNSGRANVSAVRSAPMPNDLQSFFDAPSVS